VLSPTDQKSDPLADADAACSLLESLPRNQQTGPPTGNPTQQTVDPKRMAPTTELLSLTQQTELLSLTQQTERRL
jgi:hypothetical protein